MKHLTIFLYAKLIELFEKALLLSNTTIKLLFIPGLNNFRLYNSKVKAYAEFVKAKRRVPAYRDFLLSQGYSRPTITGMVPNINEIPFTDKDNYVKVYSMDERCVGGIVSLIVK